MGPIYEAAVLLAQEWHGHHLPALTAVSAAALPRRLILYALTTAPSGISPVVR